MSIALSDSLRLGKKPERLAVFASVGPRLLRYEVDVENATLVERDSLSLPANVQYAWPHASGRYLYVASSNGGPWASGDRHDVSAVRIDSGCDTLQLHGKPVALNYRPVHITTDNDGQHALVAYNNPSSLTVHRINHNGTLGAAVQQSEPLDFGVYAHQIRVDTSNRLALLVTRGNDAVNGKPEDPGALKVFNYQNGMLTRLASVAPGQGYGFGPRHLDFHPTQPWVYVSLERQNKLYVFKLNGDGLVAEPLFRKETLADPGTVLPRQMAGAIHVGPGGRFLYIANRALGTTEFQGEQVSVGGENNIAVYAINQKTGEPTKIQNVDTRGTYPRTFAVDPSGRLLVVANLAPLLVKKGTSISITPANLAVFRITADGKLEYVRRYDFPASSDDIFWMGIIETTLRAASISRLRNAGNTKQETAQS